MLGGRNQEQGQVRQALELALEALENNRQTHHYCEDTWYSCPKHEEGCANESEGDECNCGADEANAEIDQAITAIKEALAQPEQEPVAWADHGVVNWIADKQFKHASLLYTTPPQRTWVGLTDEEKQEWIDAMPYDPEPRHCMILVNVIEAKLKEKNT